MRSTRAWLARRYKRDRAVTSGLRYFALLSIYADAAVKPSRLMVILVSFSIRTGQ
jgi:hypothetical protein